jgi:hypothetical protein
MNVFELSHHRRVRKYEREDNRAIAEEHAWDEFLRKTEAATKAQAEMNEAHRKYIAVKYPNGVPNGR